MLHDWRDRLIACGAGVLVTVGGFWVGYLRDQPVVNAKLELRVDGHDAQLRELKAELDAMPGKVADAVVKQLKAR